MYNPHQPPRKTPTSPLVRDADDWEHWEDEDVITPIETTEQVFIGSPTPPAQLPSSTPTTSAVIAKAQKVPLSKLKRLRSRQRQKAQNASAGIKVITDMSAFRRQNHIINQLRTPDGRSVKFVDAAALRALEGEPSSASVGNWNWLKRSKDKSPASATTPIPKPSVPTASSSPRFLDQQLSPEDRPIPIGITLPSGEVMPVSPQSAHDGEPRSLGGISLVSQDTPTTASDHGSSPSDPSPAYQQKSVWSPDSPDTIQSFNVSRTASSVYSQMPTATPAPDSPQDIPPVPRLPTTYKKMPHQRLISLEVGNNTPIEDDTGTPCTLFEEDGNLSPLKLKKSTNSAPASARSPESANSRSQGWWDHVVTPFVEKRFTFASRKAKSDSPKQLTTKNAWQQSDEKLVSHQESAPLPPAITLSTPVIREPTPRRPTAQTEKKQVARVEEVKFQRSSSESEHSIINEKSAGFMAATPQSIASEQPPPYSPPKKVGDGPIRYRAVFPPGHPLHNQFPPTPNPGSPGLAATMTSQGDARMVDIPLTPAATSGLREMTLPTRVPGTYLPTEYAHDAAGNAHRVERERRRHEKEEVVARRVGAFWRGRGCVPSTGCFGRGGREGRKRRRVWAGVCAGFTALIILIVVLSVVLSRPHYSEEVGSIWINLTDFPPMPTGILTVVGPDNTVAKSVCTKPTTLWSCTLPKDDRASVAPYKPNQPTIVLQIQWDNATQESWDVSNGKAPPKVTRRNRGSAASFASSVIHERDGSSIDGFVSDPSPPNYNEMFFLGDSTDGIQSDDKAGEATPFFISLIKSIDDDVTSPSLTKRQKDNDKDGDNNNGTQFGDSPLADLIPAPDLLDDGTPTPAVMLPRVVQQPVRLYDRDLPTEHYGFYTYFKRTIFLKSVTVLNETDDSNVPLDEDGGCAKSEADFLGTWSETRVLVQIWTRKLNDTGNSLLESDAFGGIGGSPQLVRPGTMPYPVTVTLDTHGGDSKKKFTWEWPMDSRQKLDTDSAKLLVNNMGIGGSWVNPRGTGDAKFGGFDGGTGGCKCEWVNWV